MDYPSEREQERQAEVALYTCLRGYAEHVGETEESAHAFACWALAERKEDAAWIDARSARELLACWKPAPKPTRVVGIDSVGNRIMAF